VPPPFDERLERLESYSSVAARRGLSLAAIDVALGWRPVEGEAGDALGLVPGARAMTVARTLVADGRPVAVMFDVVHPDIDLPDPRRLRAALERGRMVLDVLIEIGVAVTYARTRVRPMLLSAREPAGRALGIRGTTAGLQLEELIFAGRDDRVAYSRDLFAPGGAEVMVVRSLDSPRPARVAGRGSGRSSRAAVRR